VSFHLSTVRNRTNGRQLFAYEQQPAKDSTAATNPPVFDRIAFLDCSFFDVSLARSLTLFSYFFPPSDSTDGHDCARVCRQHRATERERSTVSHHHRREGLLLSSSQDRSCCVIVVASSASFFARSFIAVRPLPTQTYHMQATDNANCAEWITAINKAIDRSLS
jgi:hypothetical protein